MSQNTTSYFPKSVHFLGFDIGYWGGEYFTLVADVCHPLQPARELADPPADCGVVDRTASHSGVGCQIAIYVTNKVPDEIGVIFRFQPALPE